MDVYGSFQDHTERPTVVPANGDIHEEVALLRNHAMTNSESSSSSNRANFARRSWTCRTPLLLGMALWMLVMAAELSPFLFLVSTDEYQGVGGGRGDDEYDDDDDTLLALWGSTAYNVRMCTIEECIVSPCQDTKSAPFVCLALTHNEKIRGGCGRIPWASEICSDQCDATGCSFLLERAEAAVTNADSTSSSESGNRHHLRGNEDCNVECPRNWCWKNRLCGDAENAPYQCTAGLLVYGCSADKFEWTIRSTEEECSSCCKTTSCDD